MEQDKYDDVEIEESPLRGESLTNRMDKANDSWAEYVNGNGRAFPSEIDGGKTSIKMTTTNRIGTFVSGTLFLDQNLSGSNNYITMGNGDTNINLSGSINLATLDGGSF